MCLCIHNRVSAVYKFFKLGDKIAGNLNCVVLMIALCRFQSNKCGSNILCKI